MANNLFLFLIFIQTTFTLTYADEGQAISRKRDTATPFGDIEDVFSNAFGSPEEIFGERFLPMSMDYDFRPTYYGGKKGKGKGGKGGRFYYGGGKKGKGKGGKKGGDYYYGGKKGGYVVKKSYGYRSGPGHSSMMDYSGSAPGSN